MHEACHKWGGAPTLLARPLLDIKPYVPEFDQHPAERIGWLAEAKGSACRTKADNRFR